MSPPCPENWECVGEDAGERLQIPCQRAPEAPVQLNKRILRTMIEETVVDVDEGKQELVFRIHWKGGVHTSFRVHKNRPGAHRRTTDREVVDLIRELVQVSPDRSIASILNRLGYETGAGNTWTESRVRHLRSYHQIPAFAWSDQPF